MSDDPKALTVRELIERLRALPPEDMDLPVSMEGCDCDGDCCGLIARPTYGRAGYKKAHPLVVLTRTP